MSEPTKDELRRARAARVAELAHGEGGLFGMIEKLRRTYFEAFQDPTLDLDELEKLHARCGALGDLEMVLRAEIQDGIAAAANMRAKSNG